MNENNQEEKWREEFEKISIENNYYYLDEIDNVPIRIFDNDYFMFYIAGRKAGKEDINLLKIELDQQRFNNKHNLSIDQKIADEISQLKAENERLINSLGVQSLRLIQQEVSQLKAENERLNEVIKSSNEYNGNLREKIASEYKSDNEKLKDLVSRAKPCMEYIHSKLPEESEVLDKYRKWLKETEGVLK